MAGLAAVVYLLLALAVVLRGRGSRRELLYGAIVAAVLVTGALLVDRWRAG